MEDGKKENPQKREAKLCINNRNFNLNGNIIDVILEIVCLVCIAQLPIDISESMLCHDSNLGKIF